MLFIMHASTLLTSKQDEASLMLPGIKAFEADTRSKELTYDNSKRTTS